MQGESKLELVKTADDQSRPSLSSPGGGHYSSAASGTEAPPVNRELDLSRRKLSELDLSRYPNLEVLDCSSNHLSSPRLVAYAGIEKALLLQQSARCARFVCSAGSRITALRR